MRIGCNTVLFGSVSLETAVKTIVQMGFDAVELACLPGMAPHVVPQMPHEAIDQARQVLADLPIPAVAMEAATDLTDPARRDWFYQALALAKSIGVPLVTTGSGGKNTPESLENLMPALGEVAREAARQGVRVALKAHVGQAVYNVESALHVMKAHGSAFFGINYDATHLFRVGEDVLAALNALAPHIIHVHFRDMGGEGAAIGPPEKQICGRGKLDLPPLLARLVELGYQGAIDLEVIGAAQYPLERSVTIAAESLGYIKRSLEVIRGRRGLLQAG